MSDDQRTVTVNINPVPGIMTRFTIHDVPLRSYKKILILRGKQERDMCRSRCDYMAVLNYITQHTEEMKDICHLKWKEDK